MFIDPLQVVILQIMQTEGTINEISKEKFEQFFWSSVSQSEVG